MTLKINEYTIYPAQFYEIYNSSFNDRKLAEAMSLPEFVVTEVRRQIKEEGLKQLQPDVKIEKKIVFHINHKRVDMMKTTPLKAKETNKTVNITVTENLDARVLLKLADAATLLMPAHFKEIFASKHSISASLAKLVANKLVHRTDNARYTLTYDGIAHVKQISPDTVIHEKVFSRIEHYSNSAAVENNVSPYSTLPVATTPTPKTEASDQPVSEMVNDLMAGENNESDELAELEKQLSLIDQADKAQLTDMPQKLRILSFFATKHGGLIGRHLAEIESFISPKRRAMKMKKLFWISWFQPTEDHRPLTFPPNQAVLGWWCSGDDALCAMVTAESEEEAKQVIHIDWPEAENWRFCDETKKAVTSDRFPIKDWMVERFKAHS